MQTEDKGLDTPLMLTLVYTQGEILASKRVRYDDLIETGFDEKILAERLMRQHKLICAAIRAGRLGELKKMSERESASRSPTRKKPSASQPPPVLETAPPIKPEVVVKEEVVDQKPAPPPRSRQRLPPPLHRPSVRVAPVSKPEPVPVLVPPATVTGASMHLVLVDEKNYRGGDRLMLRVRVEAGDNQKHVIPGAEVIVKILGSTFRPLIYQSQTGTDGIAVFRTELPHFLSGRAAILIRAAAGGVEAELRRIIQQG